MFSQISSKISAIPTTLITGFLGVGKTTAILQLLANKPNNENWAVLVNEFGEIGIDSALLAGSSNEQGVFIREVPGGCMCCASGVPMQVALNQLITKAKPDRLLIEPTGLGHPKEVVEVLTKGKFQETISLQSILCLVDARNLIDKRYTEHPSFVQQLNVADTILAAKADTYSAKDEENLALFIAENELTDKPLHLMQHGNIAPSWLAQQPKTVIVTKPMIGIAVPSLHESSHTIELGYKKEREQSQALQTRLAQEGFIELNNHGEGYFSKGWIFSDKYQFNYKQLFAFITALKASRAKGVILTEQGSYAFNKAGSDFSCNKVTDSKDSRIELIDTNENALNIVKSRDLLLLAKDAI
ncbi:CobW family GTP-binding protein [Colwellia psychrerythraea]|uniref:Cobalamin synthesis protein/P47K family protein n=1 Tax=Colwellia psychrerythraea (strain 34H / ATCC BAA-681) TaxID=167879 RepID=Q486H2_COLP3|nr:GTP-binding protein [Colwellia psychrerythraea]AAZ25187.1 cobalamin synthesis protein/P47K family protein [Colwellia psychrerythraea 34H]